MLLKQWHFIQLVILLCKLESVQNSKKIKPESCGYNRLNLEQYDKQESASTRNSEDSQFKGQKGCWAQLFFSFYCVQFPAI